MEIQRNRHTHWQLQDLDKELQGFYRKGRHDGQELSILDVTKWMIHRGALDKNGAVVPDKTGYPLYEQLSEDLRQWSYWKKNQKSNEG